MPAPDPVRVSISPEPSGAELAAILAAYRELWPSPPPATTASTGSTRWRFSGRWWSDGTGQRIPPHARPR